MDKDKPQTFNEAHRELKEAADKLFTTVFPWFIPFMDWLSKKLERFQ